MFIEETAKRHPSELPPSTGMESDALKESGPGFRGFLGDGEELLNPSASRDWLVEPFQPISLKQIEAQSAMLDRLDNKYVVNEAVLRRAVAELADHFDILEINDKRNFTYETCYFDDAQRVSYSDHHQGRRIRCKVRVRKYTDAQLCFLEVKLKDKRGITIKKRLKYTAEQYGMLDENAWAYIRSSYDDLYGRDFNCALEPAIETHYIPAQGVIRDTREGH